MYKNYYEEIIDNVMIDLVSKSDNETEYTMIKDKLLRMDLKNKRLAILSILDKDRGIYKSTDVSKTEHIKRVVSMMREYVKVSDVEKKQYGEVMTPISLVEEMLNQLPKEVWSNPNLKWLDPANGVGVFPSVVVDRLMTRI